MFAPELRADAERVLELLRARGWKLATAESCTGGLMAALLTEIPGSSDVLDRGFVTYSDASKSELLGVRADLIREAGAVSREVAEAMAAGALQQSSADIAVSVTGIAGPDGGTPTKPVGLVYVAAVRRNGGGPMTRRCDFGAIGRSEIRLASVRMALDLVLEIGT